MPICTPPVLRRIFQLAVLSVAVSGGLLHAPGVQAAERKKVAAKKTHAVQAVKQRRVVVTKPVVASKGRGERKVAATRVAYEPPRLSFGQVAGLHSTQDPLALKSSVALVIDQDTHEVLLSKNEQAVLPIASITKLMTGTIVTEANLSMEDPITITQDDVDTEKGSSSRLTVGTTLSRGEMLHLALMSSENRAAHALGRTHPGGLAAFVAHMNAKANMLGMTDTKYSEPTGLSSRNQSSARDLAILVNNAYKNPVLRELTTSPGYEVAVGRRTLQYNNTNRLVKSPLWEIGLQKTGYISEAGQCLVMQARVSGRHLIMVFLDSAGKLSRIGDAERVRKWVETLAPSNASIPSAAIKQVSG